MRTTDYGEEVINTRPRLKRGRCPACGAGAYFETATYRGRDGQWRVTTSRCPKCSFGLKPRQVLSPDHADFTVSMAVSKWRAQ